MDVVRISRCSGLRAEPVCQVYPDMHEVEMGDPVRDQLGSKSFNVNLKSGRSVALP